MYTFIQKVECRLSDEGEKLKGMLTRKINGGDGVAYSPSPLKEERGSHYLNQNRVLTLMYQVRPGSLYVYAPAPYIYAPVVAFPVVWALPARH